MKEEGFIPGIYNYCDRWCERCSFTARCRNYASFEEFQREEGGILPDIDNQKFWEHLNRSFQQAMDLVREHVEAQGIDWEEFKAEAMAQEMAELEFTPEQKALENLATHYHEAVSEWFEQYQFLFEEKSAELKQELRMGLDVLPEARQINDATEVIKWYMYFISTKLNRALRSAQDKWMAEDDPVQNDANGSAKVTLIAVQRSLAAWEILRSFFPEQTDSLLDLFILLGKLERGIREQFPQVERFVRPGFDEG